MDPFHRKQVAAVERIYAENMDKLAAVIEEGNLNAAESGYILRFAAGKWRENADQIERSA